MEARLAAADTEYGALEAMAFGVEGLRSQIRDQARLASAYRGVAASPTKGMLRAPLRLRATNGPRPKPKRLDAGGVCKSRLKPQMSRSPSDWNKSVACRIGTTAW